MLGRLEEVDRKLGAWPAKLCAGLLSSPRRAALLLGLIATVPWWFHREAEYKSDDFLIIARGVETGIIDGLWRNLSRPFCDTWTIEFYRPLFTWSFCLEGNLFGDRPHAYLIVNLLWHAAAVATGFLLLCRLLRDRGAALLATLLFIANPWSANNVSWLVGRCSVTATLLIFLAVLSYLKGIDREAAGDARRLSHPFARLPWRAFGWAFVGVFYRETALYATVLIFLVDLVEGRRDLRALRDWCFLTLPFCIYMVVKIAVLGTAIGGYARLAATQGRPFYVPMGWDALASFGAPLLDLFAPGDGALMSGFDDGLLRIATLASAGALVLVGSFTRSPRWRACFLFIALIAAHTIPLLAVDRAVHGGTAQRWYTVMWAIAALYASLAMQSRLRTLGVAVVLALTAFSGLRLHDNLVDYDDSSVFSRRIRERVVEAGEDVVFVYNLISYDRASAFYAVGMGQSALPPFADGKKAVYPVFYANRYGSQAHDQVPVASWLHARGEKVSAIYADFPNREVHFIPQAHIEAGLAKLSAYRRLPVSYTRNGNPVEPANGILRDVDALEVAIDAAGLARVDVHVICPLSHLYFSRYRGNTYFNASFDDDRYRENLLDLLEPVTLMDGAARGRCWIWWVGYDRVSDPERELDPVAVSDFVELHVTIPQAEPKRRP